MLNYKGLSKIIATIFFLGYSPIAPGTCGTLAAFFLILIIRPNSWTLLIFIIILSFVGTICAHITERQFGVRDSQKIIIDEFLGYLISIVFLPLTLEYLILAFFLFRFLDILKPVPIRNIESLFQGGVAIMIDDMAAGVITNLSLQLYSFL
ncbi:MAG: phosphatidylglycerophosphatase A [Thermodesulfovibrionales bacterium]|nr:phosphatidylglycerophosphatase A [Thermodesulfovibrionales bacterium]